MAGRKVFIQFVLMSMLIYLAMATDLPPWAIRAIDKIRRGFLWRGRKDARGGHCLVVSGKVCRPIELGGLGISDLKNLCWALRMRWLWLQKTNSNRPWVNLQIQVSDQARIFFSMATMTEVGDGARTLFWSDRWTHGQRIQDLAPHLFATISKRRIKTRTIQDAMQNYNWLLDIQDALNVGAIVDFLRLGLLQVLNYNPRWKIFTFGDYVPLEYTVQNLPMRVFLLAPHTFILGKGSGKLGHLLSVGSFYGL